MSAMYGLDLFLAELFNEKNIETILKNGLNFGIIYYKDILEATGYKLYEPLNLNQAIKRILDYKPGEMELGPLIISKFKDTRFHFRIYKEEDGSMEISIGSFGPRWEKLFWGLNNCVYVDFARYTDLMLTLSEGFTITKIEKWSEYE